MTRTEADITLVKVPELSYPWTGEELRLIRFPELLAMRRKPLEHYFNMQGYLLWASHNADDASSRSIYSQVWSHARDARIFEIPTELYLALYVQAGRHTCRMICGSPELPDQSSIGDIQEYSDKLASLSAHMDLPEQRPFECFYFGYTFPMVVPKGLEPAYHLGDTGYKPPYNRKDDDPALLVGHLFTPDDNIWGLFLTVKVREREGKGGYSLAPQLMNDRWFHPVTLQPWTLPALVEWINEHRTIVQEVRGRFSHKRISNRYAPKLKLKKLAPPPYYSVYLKNVVIEETAQRAMAVVTKRQIDWQHRWTVRGHYMVRIKRGPLPLDAKLETELRKRKYRIFTLDELDPETAAMLQAREIRAKSRTEWMAVLVSWRRDYVKGPEDKPLIPSIRKVKEDTCQEKQ